MDRGSARLGAAALALVALWIVVYWWSPADPRGDAPIAFEQPGGQPERSPTIVEHAPAPRPVTPRPPAPDQQPAVRTDLQLPRQALEAPPVPAPAQPALTATRSDPSGDTAGRAPAAAIRQPVVRKPGEVIPPTFFLYTVEPGDTAEKISKRFYGTPDLWATVLKANPQRDFTRLRPGQTIRVPKDPTNVQGVPGDGGELSPTNGADKEKSTSSTRYVVKEGDTLGEISKAFYGRSALWTVIRDANREKVGDDGRSMRPGQTLIIPPAPTPAQP